MKLALSMPLMVLVECDDITYLRAEDATGAFGILSGHADFLTVLAPSVVSWRENEATEHHAAVRGGVLEVRGGRSIAIATPEAVLADNLQELESLVLATYRVQAEQERRARTDEQKLFIAAVRQICQLLRPTSS